MISPLRKTIGGLLAATLAFGATLSAIAPASAQYAVPGAPGVADVSVAQGDVVIVRGDSGAQVGAAINTPMLPGDYITTAGGSRAEVQFDGISMIRLASDTQVRMVNLNPGSREVQLASGTAELAVLQGGDGGSQIDTPSVTVRPSQPGDYRVTVLPNGQTAVTVRSGMATVSSGNGSENLTPGTTLVAYGPYNAAQVSMQAPIRYDSFDNWNARRDRMVVAAYNANPYLSPALAGYADFANYGQWYNVPGYGQSWAPYNQSDNWSPYSNGQWVWEPGYGYTWVGNEPWGYVPYHYGNWYYATGYNQWMWQPPTYQYQNPDTLASAWLPALVAFFLTGGNTNAALSAGLNAAFNPTNPYGYGNIGWVPLAPGEQYTPWYAGFGANAGFPQTTLSPVTNVTNVYNVYRNIRYIKVVRVIPVNRFRNGDFRSTVAMPVRDVVRHLTIVRGAVPVVPTKAVLAVKPAPTTIHLSTRFSQPVFAAKAPEIVRTASFERQATELKTVVTTKPRVEPVQTRTATVTHPIYQAPTEHRTYSAPVQVTRPATVTPPRQATPERTAAPNRFVPPEQRTTPERTMAPERTMVPERQAVPRTEAPNRFVPPEQRTAPERTTAPEQRTTPERTAAPQRTNPERFVPSEQQRMSAPRATPATPAQRATPAVPGQQPATPADRATPATPPQKEHNQRKGAKPTPTPSPAL